MKARTTRRALVARAVDDDARRALIEFATAVGVAPDRAAGVADEAVVRVLRDRVPGDHAMVDTLLRLEVRRIAADPQRPGPASGGTGSPAAPPRAALVRRVRLARARRVTLTAGAVVTACALTVGASAALIRLDRAPAEPLSQVPAAPPPTVVEEPSAPATPRVLGNVTVAEGLPPAQPLVEGMLEAADTGWSLVQLDAVAVEDRTFFYLMDPESTLFEVPTPFSGASWIRDPELVDWLPGTRLVLMRWSYQHEAAVVDILTGERILTVPFGLQGHEYAQFNGTFVKDGTTDLVVSWDWSTPAGGPSGERVVRLGLDGIERAAIDVSPPFDEYVGPLLSDDGTRLAVAGDPGVRILDADDFSQVGTIQLPDGRASSDCGPVHWLGADAVLLGCDSPASTTFALDLWAAPVDGAGLAQVAADVFGSVWAAGDGLVLVEAVELPDTGESGWTGWGSVLRRCDWDGTCADERFGETPTRTMPGVVDGTLYAYDAPYEGGLLDGQYVAVDLATGETRTLLDAGPDASIRVAVPLGVRGPTWHGWF